MTGIHSFDFCDFVDACVKDRFIIQYLSNELPLPKETINWIQRSPFMMTVTKYMS